MLWFAEKFVSLLIEQHLTSRTKPRKNRCDLLKNSYLCLLNNTRIKKIIKKPLVVICWKIRIFAYWTTPMRGIWTSTMGCDLLKNSYLCLLNNTSASLNNIRCSVVICWKIRIFAYWTTPGRLLGTGEFKLWFAEKFVSLLIEQHQHEHAGN